MPAAKATSEGILQAFRAQYGIPNLARCDSAVKLAELLGAAVAYAEKRIAG